MCTEGCHVGHLREFVGTAYCIYGHSNAANEDHKQRVLMHGHQG